MNEREMYANPPVVLAALEIRHPSTPSVSSIAASQIKRALAAEVPLMREDKTATLAFGVAAIAGAQPEVSTETSPRFVSRDGATAVTFRREAIVVETTRYDHFERIRDLALLAVHARQATEPVDGVDRIGLRYIDEIRVQETGPEPTAWEPWIDSALLAPATLGATLGLTPVQMQGVVVFDAGQDQTLVLRHGPRVGYAVDPGGDLKRTTTPPGPFYLLDIDSFWIAGDHTPAPEASWLRDTCDALHRPVRSLFERLITERLRDEVLRDHG